MPEIKNNFLQGKMNKDLDDRLLPSGEYRDAMNIQISKSEGSDVGTAQNIKGNAIPYGLSLDFPKSGGGLPLWDVIGSYADSNTGYVFWFVTSFTGTTSDKTIQFTTAKNVEIGISNITHAFGSNTFTVSASTINTYRIQVGMLVDEANVPNDTYIEEATYDTNSALWTIVMNKNANYQMGNSVTLKHTCRIYGYNIKTNQWIIGNKYLLSTSKLNFSKNHLITGVNLLDDLLFWTDNYNQPRRINLSYLIESPQYYYNFTDQYEDFKYIEDRLSVATYAPYSAPTVRMEYDSNISSNHILNEFSKFAYRFKFDNNEYSLISPFTQHCFHPGDENSSFNTGDYSVSPTVDAGIVPTADQEDIYKQTTVKLMQNKANKINLLFDIPGVENKQSVAAATINGTTSSNIIAINNVVNNWGSNYHLVTEQGDVYSISGVAANQLTLTETPNPPIKDGTRIYCFTQLNTSDYGYSAGSIPQVDVGIKKVEVVYAESDSTAIRVIDILDFKSNFSTNIKVRAIPIESSLAGYKAKLRWCFEYVYKSTKPLRTLPEQDIIRVSDIIPVRAKAQEISGNRLIYGNFLQNRSLDTALPNKNIITTSNGDQAYQNKQYLLSSVKSNRTYQIGLVLSDRYGRQSTVFLPEDSTTFIPPYTGASLNGANSWNHYALKATFNDSIGDVYDPIDNPLGWYSYKIVVKQTEQEYYNVYGPGIIDAINGRSWLVLHGDNINKVPRDVTDVNTETGVQGSQTKLLPKILNTSGSLDQRTDTRFLEVISIGTGLEQGLNDALNNNPNEVLPQFFNEEKNPLIAELPDGFGTDWSTIGTGNPDELIVFETEPFKSALDIYYETSTAGLISELNEQISANIGSGNPADIDLHDANNNDVTSFSETITTGDKIGDLEAFDTGASPVSCTFALNSITNANGTDRSGAFTISGAELLAGEEFEFKNNNEDTYNISITATKTSSTETHTQLITLDLTNANPTITVGNIITIASSTNQNTIVKTVTAVNGSAKTSAQTNNITFSKTAESETTAGNTNFFSINSTSGAVSYTAAQNLITQGERYTLTLRATDVGGAYNEGNLIIDIGSANYNTGYRAQYGYTSSTTAGDEPTGVPIWHSGSGTYPQQNDTIYSDSSGNTAFVTGIYWYAISAPNSATQGNALYVFKTDSNGVVTNFQLK